MNFQELVHRWMQKCFGPEISADTVERNHRFFEEATELVQSTGMTASEAHQLVDYVYGRPVGDPSQEVGGTMVTLAALCLANGIDLDAVADMELVRISSDEVMQKIRDKQAAKPKHSPLPEVPLLPSPWRNDIMELAIRAGVAPNTIFHFEAAFLRFADLLTKKLNIQRAAPVSEVPRVDDPRAIAALEAMNKEYNYPCNPANCARYGWEAARRFLNATTPQPVEVQSELLSMADANYRLTNLVGCFDAAISEGLYEALAETNDTKLKDLVERRLLHGYTETVD